MSTYVVLLLAWRNTVINQMGCSVQRPRRQCSYLSWYSLISLLLLCTSRKPILILPPIDSKTIMVEFAPAERQFYDALHRKSLNLFEGFIQAGTASKSWLAIFSLLHRLRQMCDHVALTVKAHLDQDEWNFNIAAQTSENNSSRKPKGRVPSEQGGGIDQKVSIYLLWWMFGWPVLSIVLSLLVSEQFNG